MSYNTDPMGAALDRHITGNWGEDQFRGEAELEDLMDRQCPKCALHGQCMLESGESDAFPCVPLMTYIEIRSMEDAEADEAMYEDWWIEEAIRKHDTNLSIHCFDVEDDPADDVDDDCHSTTCSHRDEESGACMLGGCIYD